MSALILAIVFAFPPSLRCLADRHGHYAHAAIAALPVWLCLCSSTHPYIWQAVAYKDTESSVPHIYPHALLRLQVFQIIATDTFVNFEENSVSDTISDVRRNSRVAIVGFVFMASVSLLMVVLDTLQFPQHGDHAATGGSGRREHVAEKV